MLSWINRSWAHEASEKSQDAAIKQLQSDMMALKGQVDMVATEAAKKTDARGYCQFQQRTDWFIQQSEGDARRHH